MQWGAVSQKQLRLRRDEGKSRYVTEGPSDGKRRQLRLKGQRERLTGGDEPAGKYVRSVGVLRREG
ncbi:MAG: hypothetical protein Kow00111_03890 [Thermincola ferriacetica]